MLFPDVSPSREQVFAALADALVSKSTRIYLDASLLIHAYEISLAGRDELLDALETFGDRLGIPLWAARETWEFMRGRISRRPLESPASRLKKELDRFRAEALRYVDDDTLSDMSKEEYQAKLEAALKAVRDLSNRVASHEPKADVTTARLMPFIEARRLNSDLVKILEVVGRTATTRAVHSVPPGFADSPVNVDDESEYKPPQKNRGKQKNPHGDLIIWLEALADCLESDAEELVIITRDTSKGDWVYVPEKIKDEQGRPQENAGLVTMPSPLLVHEALRSCPRLKGLYVVSLEMLAHVLQRNLRIAVPNLAAAIQAGDEEPRRHPATAEQVEPAEFVAAEEAAAEPIFESSDMTYDFPHGDEIDDLLRSLSVEGWRVQNEAVRSMEPFLRKATRDQLVQIGRGLVAAANDGALEPIDLLRRVFGDRTFSRTIQSDILIGILAEIYVAESGEPKKPEAHPELINVIYGHENKPELQAAYGAVLGRLAAQRRTYLGLPTDHATPVPIEVTLEGKRLRALKVFGNSLLEEDAPASRALRRTGQEIAMSAGDLMAEVSREFVVPAGILSPDIPAGFQLQLPENIGYVPWGPNTGAFLR
jgi:histone H3/H4